MGVGFYGVLFTIMLIVLSVNVSLQRQKTKIMLGNGESFSGAGAQALQRAVRAHANFAEYTPLFMILILIIAIQGLKGVWIDTMGLIFFVGRLSHAYGLLSGERYTAEGKLLSGMGFRIFGMACTFVAFLLASGILLRQAGFLRLFF